MRVRGWEVPIQTTEKRPSTLSILCENNAQYSRCFKYCIYVQPYRRVLFVHTSELYQRPWYIKKYLSLLTLKSHCFLCCVLRTAQPGHFALQHISGLLSQVVGSEKAETVTAIVCLIVSKCVRKLYITCGFYCRTYKPMRCPHPISPSSNPSLSSPGQFTYYCRDQKAAFLRYRQTDRVDETYLMLNTKSKNIYFQ